MIYQELATFNYISGPRDYFETAKTVLAVRQIKIQITAVQS